VLIKLKYQYRRAKPFFTVVAVGKALLPVNAAT
jgi:hypothetical protein